MMDFSHWFFVPNAKETFHDFWNGTPPLLRLLHFMIYPMFFLRLVQRLTRPHGASSESLYLLHLLLHLLFWFRGCHFGPGMNGRFPLISVTPLISQLLLHPGSWHSESHVPERIFYHGIQQQHYFVILWLAQGLMIQFLCRLRSC